MHERVCLHQVAFAQASTADFIAYCRDAGIAHMTLATPILMQPGEMERAMAAVSKPGPRAAVINHPIAMGSSLDRVGEEESEKLHRAIDIAATLGANAIYLVTGGRGRLDWEAAARRFVGIVEPCKSAAIAKGVNLLIEPAGPFNSDMHIAHTLDDTILLAEMSGIGVCLDLQQVWFESGLKHKFARAMPKTGLVQVSDYVYGDRCTPCRAVPGDGVIPLERLIGEILELGYTGVFDLELIGPRIEEEGREIACKRAAQNLSELLEKLGA